MYNPCDVLLLFDSREFEAHWFETGTPTFLVDTLFERRVSTVSLDRTVSPAALLSASSSHGRLDMAVRTGGHVSERYRGPRLVRGEPGDRLPSS